MNSTSEQNLAFGDFGYRQAGQNCVNHQIPQNEAGPGSDMTAAFAAFKDKLSTAAFKKNLKQPRGGNVQISGNRVFLQVQCLVRPSSGDNCEGGAERSNCFDLFFPQIGRDKTKNANTPGEWAHSFLSI